MNYRGCRASLFEGGMRLPFIVWSGDDRLIPRGKVDNTTVVSALDMFESLCRIAHVSLPRGYISDGTDMSKALLGIPQQRSKAIYWEYRRNDKTAFPKPEDNDISPNVAIKQQRQL